MSFSTILKLSSISTDEQARARMNRNQWDALSTRMKRQDALGQLSILPHYEKLKTSKTSNFQKIKQLLNNGWATEALLVQNFESLTGDALKSSLVWAFPQAYYSVFSVTLAYFNIAGFTEGKTHASLIRKFGHEASLAHYPQIISFLACDGIERHRTFKNCKKISQPSTLHFDANNSDSVDTTIANFLNATRKSDLQDRLSRQIAKTKSNQPKKRFSDAEYSIASNNLGLTSILSLLYRKRIKSNYGNIDSLLSSELNADKIFPSLIAVVDCIHAINEAYICRAIGKSMYAEVLELAPSRIGELPKKRYSDIITI
jgi:hypothetical protein